MQERVEIRSLGAHANVETTNVSPRLQLLRVRPKQVILDYHPPSSSVRPTFCIVRFLAPAPVSMPIQSQGQLGGRQPTDNAQGKLRCSLGVGRSTRLPLLTSASEGTGVSQLPSNCARVCVRRP